MIKTYRVVQTLVWNVKASTETAAIMKVSNGVFQDYWESSLSIDKED